MLADLEFTVRGEAFTEFAPCSPFSIILSPLARLNACTCTLVVLSAGHYLVITEPLDDYVMHAVYNRQLQAARG